ncbi:MAG: molybdopterin dinucleotide binding domain-containing protein [Candidatus Thorarchaeota archaeon]|jgi:formylmethanofuran dehydrogenase subunit D
MALGDFLFSHTEFKLVITRSFEVDIEAARGKNSDEYSKIAALIQLHKSDFQRLSLKDGDRVTVESKAGNVDVLATIGEKMEEGIAVMPHGPWSLTLVSIPSDESPPQLHGIVISISRSDEPVTSIDSLLDSS